jgi:hypothetical protein
MKYISKTTVQKIIVQYTFRFHVLLGIFTIVYFGLIGCSETSNNSTHSPSNLQNDMKQTDLSIMTPSQMTSIDFHTSHLMDMTTDATLHSMQDATPADQSVQDAIVPIFEDAHLAIRDQGVDQGVANLDQTIAPIDQSMTQTDQRLSQIDQGIATRTPHSLVIALDGVRPDALAYAHTPNIDALIAGIWHNGYQGAYAPYAQNLYDASTVSGPNHVAIMTGATASQHEVTGNHNVAAGRYTNFPHYLARLEQMNPALHTAYLFTWGTDGEIPSGADYVKDGNDEENVARVIAMLDGTHTDLNGTDGTQWQRDDQPHALFLFLDDPDHVGHSMGFESSVLDYRNELMNVDEQIGRIMTALVNRPTWEQEDWQIIITSDHGGYHTSHGGMTAPEHTIPFIVSSRTVEQGYLPVDTRNIDVVPSILQHFAMPIPNEFIGVARGHDIQRVSPLAFNRDLVGYYQFEGNLNDSTAGGHHASIGSNSDVDPVLQTEGGKFGGYLSITDAGGGDRNASYITLGNPADYNFGDDDSFTTTLWFRSHGDQGGDPVIIGNKNWSSGANPGWLLLANEGGNNSFGANYAGGGQRLDLEDIDYTDQDWWFLAATFDPNGLAVVFCGDSIGRLRWMALDATQVGSLNSALPLNIGQDGSGSYPHNLDGDIDDLAIWRRTLTFDEIRTLYQQGQGQDLASHL